MKVKIDKAPSGKSKECEQVPERFAGKGNEDRQERLHQNEGAKTNVKCMHNFFWRTNKRSKRPADAGLMFHGRRETEKD